MADRTWRANRLALIAGALALLAGTPAILAAAGVKNRWVLAGATAAAAVIVVFSAIAQKRYGDQVQQRDEQELRIRDGCLVLPDGRLPAVRDVTDPVTLGVHRAAAAITAAPGRQAVTNAPAYVSRDIDGELRERLVAGGFVLLVGDSTAGKSRAAFEAVSGTLAGHVLICPSGRDAIAAAVERAAQERRCVLWLDDLERYLGAGGLTGTQIGRLLSGEGHHRVIVATIRAVEQARLIRAAEQARLTADTAGNDAGRHALRDIRQILDQAHPIRLARMFTGQELKRARARDDDPRIAEAIGHAGSYGIAEYLAAGPTLLRDWQDARDSSEGPNARGAALVAAAIDIRRAGYTSSIPRELLDKVHEQYLADPEHAHTPREPPADAWEWATRQRRATAALLRPAEHAWRETVEVFDYLVDSVQQRAGPLGHVPEPVVRAAIFAADLADAGSLATTANAQGRHDLAEQARRQAYHIAYAEGHYGAVENWDPTKPIILDPLEPDPFPDDPVTLIQRIRKAGNLRGRGQLQGAETEIRTALESMTCVLGPDHPSTLAMRSNLADVLYARGRLEEAEAETRSVVEAQARALGPDNLSTLASRDDLASVLRAQERLGEAEAETRAVLEARTRWLGPDDPDTLASRDDLASVLGAQGRLGEAEAETRAVLEARTRTLGPDDPDTLASRDDLASVLRAQGRLGEAEAEQVAPPPKKNSSHDGE